VFLSSRALRGGSLRELKFTQALIFAALPQKRKTEFFA
jgi:hypothetical protein